jgi:acyl transferase domain-containing protein/surfactin synthase thioesterase subunit/aryl carrier-like protein
MNRTEIVGRLRSKLADRLSVELKAEEDDTDFSQLGVDSLIVTELIEFIHRELEPTLTVAALYDHPSIAQLASHLANARDPGIPAEEPRTPASNSKRDISHAGINGNRSMPTSKSGYPPIAVVGVSGRFPGADNVDQLWKNLEAGLCSTGELPQDRRRYWDLTGLAERLGQSCLTGGFLSDVEAFDPAFFGISPNEASVMDPQQRLFLEESWRAIEDAGYAADGLSEVQCGVYVGVMNSDYQELLVQASSLNPKVYELTGNSSSILAARIAYYLNLRGPAMAVDTACSSSLTAVHLACRQLQAGEIDMALAGGITLFLTQRRYYLMEQAGMLSLSGVCRPFDDAADGMLPGEAVGVVVLKRLEDARRDRDSIYGVIISSGINQDGKTNGITAPSMDSQLELIREVHRRGNIDPATIQYVETHGTATKLGDPIEFEALVKAFRETSGRGEPPQFCRIGSVKANLGHTTAAAGVTGLIKILLSLRHHKIPPQINFNRANSHTTYFDSRFRINRTLESWEPESGLRRAALSSFGFSGTNAHLVVEEASPLDEAPADRRNDRDLEYWIVLSARTPDALKRRALDLQRWLERADEKISILDLSFSLAIGRSGFPERVAFAARDIAGVRAGLHQFLSGTTQGISLWRGYADKQKESLAEGITVGEAWVSGATVDWASSYEGAKSKRLNLPGYPFEHGHYWYDIAEKAADSNENAGSRSRAGESFLQDGQRVTTRKIVSGAPAETARSLVTAPATDSALLSLAENGQPGKATSLQRGQETLLVNRLKASPALARKAILEEQIRQVIGQMLRLDPTGITADTGLFDLGMSSLMAVEFRQTLEQLLGYPLAATLAMDQPRITDVVDHLLTEVLGLEKRKENRVEVARPATSVVPIAVIGLACRMPGANSATEFWELLERGEEAIREIPPERWDLEAYYHPDPDAAGRTYTRYAGLLDQVDQFDATLFGIAPREVVSMDPQQRFMLEVAWEALEAAGIAPLGLRQTRTGVYVGTGMNEYVELIRKKGLEAIGMHFATGTVASAIAGRLAFSLGLEGPALVIDTACSSSLVALHQACQALRSGECDLSLVGGVNLILSPETTIAACRARMLSPDGRCKTFDAAANGYVRAEGCAVVVLKRLDEAINAGDRILGVIRGSAVNQDGASSGLTVPNGPSQERVIRDALKQAGLESRDIAYLEAHGTGTSLGDPIEVQAAAAVLGEGRPLHHPLLLGSVKANVGHLEAAAGISGLVKVILALQHGVIPRQLNFQTPNPHIPWHRLPVRVIREQTSWPSGKRIAGINSFGFTGTNAHVIVEEPPVRDEVWASYRERSHHVLVLSAKTDAALAQLAGRYAEWLDSHPNVEFGDFCYTAGVGRSHLSHRAALVASSSAEAKELLDHLKQNQPAKTLFSGSNSRKAKVAWMFTGQGSQYRGMGQKLYATQPVVREVLDQCDQWWRRERKSGPSLLDTLFENEELLNHTSCAQPALFALEVSFAKLLGSWALEPDVVLGHSLGQYAAAVVAGIFDLEDGFRLVAKRADLMGQLPSGGAMGAVFTNSATIRSILARESSISLAADNGTQLVLSGPKPALEEILSDLSRQGTRSQLLNTSHAFHSELMEPILDEFEAYAARFKYRPAERTLICNLTGETLMPGQVLNANYWRRHIREPVQFSRSLRTVAGSGVEMLVELGPRGILVEMAELCWPPETERPLGLALLKHARSDSEQIAELIAQCYAHGLTPDFAGWDRPWPRQKLAIPTYPFQHARYWVDGEDSQASRRTSINPSREELEPRTFPESRAGSLVEGNQSETVRQREPSSGYTASLQGMLIEERLNSLIEYLQQAVTEVLELRASPEVTVGFSDLGMDSLMAVEFRSRISKDLELKEELPATTLFDFPDVQTLARHLTALKTECQTKSKRDQLKQWRSSNGAKPGFGPDEPIAVVGLSCRLPGASDPEEFWHLLASGSHGVSEVPAERWDVDAYYDPDTDKPGKIYTRYAGFLKDVYQFDAAFFQISPREAASLDPQQRLLLELSWEALEHGAFGPERLKESRTGVYMGMSTADYMNNLSGSLNPEAIDAYVVTGNVFSTAVGRISYLLGLHGPSIALDTACSSSLVALHQACKDLRLGECDLALAGGVNALLSPFGLFALCRGHMLSPDGRCKTFDAAANGYVRSEGGGVVVLKRLTEAQRDGDRILALIRGSAINQDGASAGLTAPNGPAQESVIQDALNHADVEPHEVAYLEAHGTGTSLGDPIEVQAAAAVYGEGRDADRPLLIGSVKTNIGHLEPASGVAGLIKVILSMQHGVIPKLLHFQTPNPHIAWDRLPVKVTAEAAPWPEGKKIAGISSFGFSGTNAHVIVEEPPVQDELSAGLGPGASPRLLLNATTGAFSSPPSISGAGDPRGRTLSPASTGTHSEQQHHLLVLSARNEAALKTLAQRYHLWLEQHPEVEIGDVAYTTGIGRSHMSARAALAVDSIETAKQSLNRLARNETGSGLFFEQVRCKPKVAWLFTGQGSQYVNMGWQLYQTQPVFRDILDHCAAWLEPKREVRFLDVIFGNQMTKEPGGTANRSWIDHTSYTQPAIFALEVALAELLRSWGQEPDVVLGHSVGQYAAAVVAGVMSLEDGMRLIAIRAELMGRLPPGGAMAAVFARPERIDEILSKEPRLSLAADNGTHLVLSGSSEVLIKLLSDLAAENIRSKLLNTSHAFHSGLMDPILDEFEATAEELEFRPPARKLICNTTGELVAREQSLDADYWREHIRKPVQFRRSILTAANLGVGMLVEVGPQPVLLGMIEGCWPADKESPVKVATFRRDRAEEYQMTEAIGQFYVHGFSLDFAALNRPQSRRKLALPTYPFQRRRYCVDQAASKFAPPTLPPARTPSGLSAVARTSGLDPLEGERIDSPTQEQIWEFRLSRKNSPELNETDGVLNLGQYKRMIANVLRPGQTGKETIRFEEMEFLQFVQVPEEGEKAIHLVLEGQEGAGQRFRMHTRNETDWILHASGIAKRVPEVQPPPLELGAIGEPLDQQMQGAQFYTSLKQRGWNFGPRIQCIDSIKFRRNELLARLNFSPDELKQTDDPLGVPTKVFQGCGILFAVAGAEYLDPQEACMMLKFGRVTIFPEAAAQPLWCHFVVSEQEAGKTLFAHYTLCDAAGRAYALVENAQYRPVNLSLLVEAQSLSERSGGNAAPSDLPHLNELTSLSSEQRREFLAGYLTELLAESLRMSAEEVDVNESFKMLGLDSIGGTWIRSKIDRDFGVLTPMEMLVAEPTIQTLVDQLLPLLSSNDRTHKVPALATTASNDRLNRDSWLVRRASKLSPKFRLYCLPYAGGGPSVFVGWRDRLPEVELCAIQLPGRENRLGEKPIEDLSEIITVLSSILIPELDIPYAIYGHSMGALIAYRLARYLSKYATRKPGHLFVGALTAPHLGNPLLERFRGQCLARGFTTIPTADEVGDLSVARELLTEFVAMLGNESILNGFSNLVESRDVGATSKINVANAALRALLADLRMMFAYQHEPEEPISVPITAFHGTHDPAIKLAEMLAWQQLTVSHFQCHTLSGDHFFLLKQQDEPGLVNLISHELTGGLTSAAKCSVP